MKCLNLAHFLTERRRDVEAAELPKAIYQLHRGINAGYARLPSIMAG
jgi:hypothetical protein